MQSFEEYFSDEPISSERAEPRKIELGEVIEQLEKGEEIVLEGDRYIPYLEASAENRTDRAFAFTKENETYLFEIINSSQTSPKENIQVFKLNEEDLVKKLIETGKTIIDRKENLHNASDYIEQFSIPEYDGFSLIYIDDKALNMYGETVISRSKKGSN